MGAPRVSHSDRGELGTAQRNLRKRNAATFLRKLCVFNFASLSGGTDAGLGDSFSHAAMAAGVAIMVSNSIGVKRPSAA